MKSVPAADLPPPAEKHLTRMVLWSHQLLAAALPPGALAVDLTAGTGRDTLFLFRCVGQQGRILAFDVQGEALARTEALLTDAGARVFPRRREDGEEPFFPGVHLIHDSHADLDAYLRESPRGIIANLGYLPGGDPCRRTEMTSTVRALDRSLELLSPGGRIAVVAYSGHPGGREESRAVEAMFRRLSARSWQVLKMEVTNRDQVPFLLVAEKSDP